MRQGHKETIDFYKLYLKTHPNSSRVAFNLGMAYKDEGNTSLAKKYLEDCQRLLPADTSMSKFSREFIRKRLPKILDDLKAG